MKFSKAQIFANSHKTPAIRFEGRALASFSGMIVFQLLFRQFALKKNEKMLFPSEDTPNI